MSPFGKLMREMLLSNHEAALVFGVDHSTISRWNTGTAKPSADMGELICNVLYQETGKLYHPFNLWEGRLRNKKTVYAARMSINEARAQCHRRRDGFVNALLADGLDAAIIGTATDGRVIYSLELAVGVLVDRDQMDQDEAREYLMFNSVGAHVGPGTPVWVETL